MLEEKLREKGVSYESNTSNPREVNVVLVAKVLITIL
jgi:hypothetical protein